MDSSYGTPMTAHTNFCCDTHICVWNVISQKISRVFVLCKLLEDADIFQLIIPNQRLSGQNFHLRYMFLVHCEFR